MATITATVRENLIGIYTGMFKKTPGADAVSEMVTMWEAGKNQKQIAAELAKKPAFAAEYPALQLASEFADEVVAWLAGEASSNGKSWATDWIIGKLNKGVSKADIIVEAVLALRVATNTADFGNAKANLNNKIEVGVYHAVTKDQKADSTTTIDGVTSSAASVTSAKGEVDATAAAASGQTFTLTASSPSVTEGNSGSTVLSYRLQLDKTPAEAVTVNVSTSGGTATAGVDYVPVSSSVTFAAGQTVAFVNITVNGDADFETAETIVLSISGSALTASVSATGSISNDDTDPSLVPRIMPLTNGVDAGANFTGGGGNDTFNATIANNIATLNNLDVLAGGLGTDTLNVELNGVAVTPASLTSVEQINVTSTAAGSTLTLTNATGVTGITSSASAGSLTVSNIETTATTITIANTAQDHTLNYAAAAVAGAADSATVTVNNVTASADLIIGAGVETLSLTVDGANDIDTDFAGTMILSGAGTLVLTGTGANNVAAASLDASQYTGGGLSLTLTNAAHTVVGTTANDTVTVGNGADNISGNDGNDRFVFAGNLTAADTISGGNGTDTLTFTGGTVADTLFANMSSVETLIVASAGAASITLGTQALATGVTALDLSGLAGAPGTLSATAFTVGLSVTMGALSDSIATGSGNDTFIGGSNNIFDGGETISAGTGTDTIRVTGASSTATLDFDSLTGIEQVVVAGTTGADSVTVSLAEITSTTTQTISVDAAALTGASDALTVSSSVTDTGGNTSFSITGAAGNDILAGGLRADTIAGGAGNDSLAGNAGNDVLDGGAGSDTIDTGAGNDSVVGGDANDRIVLGANLTAADTIAGGDGTDTLTVNALTTSGDSLFANISSVETLVLAAGTSTIGANAQTAGVTTVDISAGQSTLSATAFTVGLTVTMGANADSVNTGTGNDIFTGGDGIFTNGDTISGRYWYRRDSHHWRFLHCYPGLRQPHRHRAGSRSRHHRCRRCAG
jgi:hypothetical protein